MSEARQNALQAILTQWGATKARKGSDKSICNVFASWLRPAPVDRVMGKSGLFEFSRPGRARCS
jgi:hypothetical protein